MRHTGAFVLAVGVLASPTTGFAREPPANPIMQPPLGGQVRVRSSALARQVEGVVVALDADTLTLAAKEPGLFKIPVQSIQRLELRTGSRRNILRGFLIGAAIGAAAGLTDEQGGCGWTISSSGGRGGSAVCGGVGGAMIGLGVGALVKSDVWVALPLSSVPPASGGRFGVNVAISF